jgi:hypothetical protein
MDIIEINLVDDIEIINKPSPSSSSLQINIDKNSPIKNR